MVYPYAEPTNDIRKRNFGNLLESKEKILTVDDNGKVKAKFESTSSKSSLDYEGVLKTSPPTSSHGMRSVKSLSGNVFMFIVIVIEHFL